jgi:hypothetical protein
MSGVSNDRSTDARAGANFIAALAGANAMSDMSNTSTIMFAVQSERKTVLDKQVASQAGDVKREGCRPMDEGQRHPGGRCRKPV